MKIIGLTIQDILEEKAMGVISIFDKSNPSYHAIAVKNVTAYIDNLLYLFLFIPSSNMSNPACFVCDKRLIDAPFDLSALTCGHVFHTIW